MVKIYFYRRNCLEYVDGREMGKYDTWSITCKLCEWQWETRSHVIAQNPKCKICGSIDCDVENTEFVTIKKHGKIITEIGFDPMHDASGELRKDVWGQTTSLNKPLLVIRENDCRFIKGLTVDEKEDLLGKMELIKTKIMRDIKESR